jgi:hypothetical protein
VIPDARQLLDRERRSRLEGSGLKRSDLVGSWRLERIWSKGSLRPATVSAALLRGLGARLQLAAAEAAEDSGGFLLVNSVNLGALELCFEGAGLLQGRRPLLVFGFDRLLLRLAGRVLMERALPPGDPRRPPFFALIAVERSASSTPGEPTAWMAARGRNGGLALWLLET